MGRRPYRVMETTVSRSSAPRAYRSKPYFDLPCSRGRWLTGSSVTLKPFACDSAGT